MPSQQQRADASCSESGSSIASTAAEEVRAEFDVRSFLACSPSRDGRPELALLQLRGHFAEFLREQSAFQEAALRRTAMSDDSSADDLDADLAAALNDPGICGKHYKIGTHSAKVGGPLSQESDSGVTSDGDAQGGQNDIEDILAILADANYLDEELIEDIRQASASLNGEEIRRQLSLIADDDLAWLDDDILDLLGEDW